MRAVVWHGIGDIRLDDVPDPKVEQPTDAVIRLTASVICGTDLHFVRGTFSGMKPGTILGHEGVGIVEALGADVRNFDVGDRVVACSTVACGTCSYCRAGYFAQCDNANLYGPSAGTCFFGGIGVDRVIDAVGVDAHHGPAGEKAKEQEQKFAKEVQQVATEQHPHDDGTFTPGDAPSQALEWAVDCIAKAGTLGIIGVFPPAAESFPIGKAMNKNLSINAGNCNHRAYIPKLVEMVRIGVIDPVKVLTKVQPLTDAIEAYGHFDKREAGWIKTELNFAEAAE